MILLVLDISENITNTDGTSELAASPPALLATQQGSWTAEKGSSLRFFSQKMIYVFQITTLQLQLQFCQDQISRGNNSSVHSTNRTVDMELFCSTLTPLTKGKTTSELRLLGCWKDECRESSCSH